MIKLLSFFFLTAFTLSCTDESEIISSSKQEPIPAEREVGGPCEDCEALLDYQILNIDPTSTDTLPGFDENEPNIKISGTVFQKDGTTPAKDVILYVYHVNREGIYQSSEHPVGWEERHGAHRGWLKTSADGKFTFYTFRPVSYPKTQEPEHIHIYVKEPKTNSYYLDSYVFKSDPMLTTDKKESMTNRGGSGIVQLEMNDGIWTADRDIILGLNIPEYDY
ncbi:MAG: intradiol ring-cleavage dioxygenase [Crocinitomicaceae bacterium]